MERIVFVVHTEYHLLVACSLICDVYNDPERYQVQVLEVGPPDSPRRQNVVDRSVLGVSCHQWDVAPGGTPDAEGSLADRVRRLLDSRIDTLVLFFEYYPLNVLLARQVRRAGGRVALGPDGVRPYYQLGFGVWRDLLIRMKRMIHVRSELRSLGLPNRFLHLPRSGYGEMSDVDELWVVHPESVKNRKRKPVRKIGVLTNPKAWRTAAALFGFQPGTDLDRTDRVVFYVNNLLFENRLYDEEIKVVKALCARAEGRVLVKLHPQTPPAHKQALAQTGATLIETSIPAELYIAHLRHSIVVSGWSASLTMENPSCHFYWLTEYFRALGCMYAPIDLVNPTTYIQEVRSLDEIQFPSGG